MHPNEALLSIDLLCDCACLLPKLLMLCLSCLQVSLTTLQPPIYGTVSGNPVHSIPAEAPIKKGFGQSTLDIKSPALPADQKATDGQKLLPEATLLKTDKMLDASGPAASGPVKDHVQPKDTVQRATANGLHELPNPPLSRQAGSAYHESQMYKFI